MIQTVSSVVLVFFLGILSWVIYVAIQRLVLSPLASVPGPRLAAVTYWYEIYHDVWKPGQYTFKIKQLHEEYGPIIRINPKVVHISDLSFLSTIYANRGRNQAGIGGSLLVQHSVGATEDWDLHKQRRDALNPYFSQKSVLTLEPLLKRKTQELREWFDDAIRLQKPINLSDAFYAFSNDVVKCYSFGSDDGLLRDSARTSVLRNNLVRLLQGIYISKHFGRLFALLQALLPWFTTINPLSPGVRDLLQFKSEIRKKIKNVFDTTDHRSDINAQRSIFHELRDTPILSPSDKTPIRLEHEATLIVLAGTESTAKSMTIASFYLLQHPDIMARLRTEFQGLHSHLSDPPSLTSLLRLPYLSAVITEADRLSFGITGRMLRYAPHNTLQYAKYSFPPRTLLCTLSLVAHTDEEIFPDPWVFDPERWMGPKGVERKKYLMAFGKGHTRCVGMELAKAEMCFALWSLAMYDLRLWETDEKDVKFQHDYQISHPRLDSKGVRAVVEKKFRYP